TLAILKFEQLPFHFSEFSGSRICELDFFNLKAKKIQAMFTIAHRRLQFAQHLSRRNRDLIDRLDLFEKGEGGFADPQVKVTKMLFGIEKNLVRVLAVKINEHGSNLSQSAKRRHLAANSRLRSTFREDFALNE